MKKGSSEMAFTEPRAKNAHIILTYEMSTSSTFNTVSKANTDE